MKLVVFDEYRIGAWDAAGIHDLTDLIPDGPAWAAPYRMNEFIRRFPEFEAEIPGRIATSTPIPRASVQLRPASPRPRNFLAAPVNYVAHRAEMTGPITPGPGTALDLGFFVKAGATLSGEDDPIELPKRDRRFDYEGEVAIVIGREARAVSRASALDHVFGYTLCLDATMRMTENEREERTLRKSFWRLGPCGPAIVTADDIPDPSSLRVRLWLNDELRQDGSLRDLIVDVPGLVQLASNVMPLEPGDLILTGSPAGIGPMSPGDVIRLASEGIGEMTLSVTRRAW